MPPMGVYSFFLLYHRTRFWSFEFRSLNIVWDLFGICDLTFRIFALWISKHSPNQSNSSRTKRESRKTRSSRRSKRLSRPPTNATTAAEARSCALASTQQPEKNDSGKLKFPSTNQ